LYSGNKEEFLTAYLKACREDELAILERISLSLRVTSARVWVLSVVAKEDLWWPERDLVGTTYGSGRYADLIAEVVATRGVGQFRHELVRASLIINNFQSGEGELLARNTAGYDHRLQVESLRRLFEAINALREWEESQ
jgi:hypothetical protein